MADLPSTQQRDVVKALSPPWLAQGNNEKYMYNLGLACDALLEKQNQAMRAHMPTLCTPSALPYIGRDRVMSQGPFESTDSFALRLQAAFDTWQRAGTRRAVMSQSSIYVSGFEVVVATQVPRIVVVSTSSAGTYATWDTYYNTSDVQKPPAHVRINPGNWNWDGVYHWWRAWLILFIDPTGGLGPAPVIGAPGVLIGDSTISIGFNKPSSFFTPLRNLIRLWKSGNTYYQWFIFSFNSNNGSTGSEMSPNSSPGSGNPDGTWGNWGTNVAGLYGPSRPSDCRFVDGTGIYQQCFVHTGT